MTYQDEMASKAFDLISKRAYNTQRIVLQHERLMDAIVAYAKSTGLKAPIDVSRSSLKITNHKCDTAYGDTIYTATLEFGGIPEDLNESNNSK